MLHRPGIAAIAAEPSGSATSARVSGSKPPVHPTVCLTVAPDRTACINRFVRISRLFCVDQFSCLPSPADGFLESDTGSDRWPRPRSSISRGIRSANSNTLCKESAGAAGHIGPDKNTNTLCKESAL